MRFGSTAKVLLKCNLEYYRISECAVLLMPTDAALSYQMVVTRGDLETS